MNWKPLNQKVTIKSREYTLTRCAWVETQIPATIYEIVGKRGATGAIVIRQGGQYKGRPISTGIAALDRLSWWEIAPAFAGIDEAVA